MSINWYRFKLRPGTSGEYAQNVVQQQSDFFRRAFNWPQPGEVITDASRKVAVEAYLKASQTLIQLSHFEGTNGKVDSHPVSAIAYNTLLPLEWREAAKRTVLPEALPAQLQLWKDYERDIRLGYYEDYLYQLFLYEDYNPDEQGYEGWHQLLLEFAGKLASSQSSGEDWAQTKNLRRCREEIGEAPVLPLSILRPDFGAEAREADLCPATKAAFAEFKKETERLMHQILAWNRCVPAVQKLRIPTFIPAQVRMHQRQTAGREWLQKFFVWADEALAKGEGLLLA
ncbi:MAG TPA: hypothetical protein ENJ82_08435, partial [Bacteroidetes bacterium]|nr:hypothetical protein [Bacteroidota bacterium]